MYSTHITKKDVNSGTVHTISTSLQKNISSHKGVHTAWEDITPLARNEWLCWIESAKELETKNRRIRIMFENLAAGKRRPCCWAGCIHRKRSP